MTITLAISGDELPVSVAVTSVTRADSGSPVSGVATPAAMTAQGGGVWTFDFDDPAGPCYAYRYGYTLTWADATTTDESGIEVPGMAAAGYYATRDGLLAKMQPDDFNAEIRLDPGASVADEVLVRMILADADRMVDGIAYQEFVSFPPASADYFPHAIAVADRPLFDALRMWAELWARGRAGWLRPGEPGGGFDARAAGVSGNPSSGESDTRSKFARSMGKAETEIRKLFQAKRIADRTANSGVSGGIGVGYSGCVPCGINPVVSRRTDAL